MHIDFSTAKGRSSYRFLVGAIAPRPIALVSTIDAAGQRNLAPFSYFNLMSAAPPVAVFSVTQPADRAKKDTLTNVLASGEAVIHIVSHAIVERMNLASVAYPNGVDEFARTGFTPVPSLQVQPPRVAEASIAFECTLIQSIPLGTARGAGTLVICQIRVMHIDDRVLTADSMSIDPQALDAVARMGDDWYCRASGPAVFSLPRIHSDRAVGVDGLPAALHSCGEWSSEELARLALAEELPSSDEVNEFRSGHRLATRQTLAAIARQHLAHFDVRSALLAAICASQAAAEQSCVTI
ncbi:MAG TPA: flavin reductase family protein [Steroidobacter sp.]|uniref:flavin reductase family protein n=1 Tax=Steroidobacter sp. TaxID=1978227 RepID=UPI002ED8F076